jgi:hypothetical protein
MIQNLIERYKEVKLKEGTPKDLNQIINELITI